VGVTRRTSLVFCAVQLLGCILGNFAGLVGQVETQNPFVMFPVLAGELLLLPGNLLAIALNETLNGGLTDVDFLLVTVACNAIFWFAGSAA
jgi:hypothetical protein